MCVGRHDLAQRLPLSTSSHEPVDYNQNYNAASGIGEHHDLVLLVFVQIIANRFLKTFKLQQERKRLNKVHGSTRRVRRVSEPTINRAAVAVNQQKYGN